MYLHKSLEKKLNGSLKEYSLIQDPIPINDERSHHQQKLKLDPKKSYDKELRVFSNDNITVAAKLAKAYLKELKDPDILELHQKPWNNCYRSNVNFRPELKKTLFEVRHGLKDVNMVKPKPKKIELGTDCRNISYFGWNSSNRLEALEKKDLVKER